jgi:formate dehydrogenase accessory protein FdhD
MNQEKANAVVKIEVLKTSAGLKEEVPDIVISEAHVSFILNDKYYRSFYCTPDYLEALVRGHLVSEGLCQLYDIKMVKVINDGKDTSVEANINTANIGLSTVTSTKELTAASIWDAVDKLNQNSILFKDTGGAHIAGIFNDSKVVFAEDVSRHCAIDKVIGLTLSEKIDLSQTVLLTSCRQTASTIAKAIYSRIPIVISTSAVSSLAIKNAEKYGITLIGFARQRRFNVYSHRERITGND